MRSSRIIEGQDPQTVKNQVSTRNKSEIARDVTATLILGVISCIFLHFAGSSMSESMGIGVGISFGALALVWGSLGIRSYVLSSADRNFESSVKKAIALFAIAVTLIAFSGSLPHGVGIGLGASFGAGGLAWCVLGLIAYPRPQENSPQVSPRPLNQEQVRPIKGSYLTESEKKYVLFLTLLAVAIVGSALTVIGVKGGFNDSDHAISQWFKNEGPWVIIASAVATAIFIATIASYKKDHKLEKVAEQPPARSWSYGEITGATFAMLALLAIAGYGAYCILQPHAGQLNDFFKGHYGQGIAAGVGMGAFFAGAVAVARKCLPRPLTENEIVASNQQGDT